MKQGIDISHWNKIINYEKVASRIDFAILKAGGSDKGFYTDPTFYKNVEQFRQYDIPIGAYYYVGRLCTSYADGVADAERFMKIISGITFEYPVYIDLESTSPKHIAGATEACKGFCNTLEKAGYYAGIYASDVSGFKDRLYLHELDRYDKWVARYGSQPKVCRDYGIWQYSSSGMLDGIAGKVDLDYSYKSYPEIMKRAHLNGF